MLFPLAVFYVPVDTYFYWEYHKEAMFVKLKDMYPITEVNLPFIFHLHFKFF